MQQEPGDSPSVAVKTGRLGEGVRIREWVLQSVLLVGLLVVVFPGTFLHGEMIFPGDILFQSPPWSYYAPEGYVGPQNPIMTDLLHAFHVWYTVARNSLDAGEWPLWNQFELGGMPLLANYQSAVFYPPRLLHAFLDIPLATTLSILLKLWLCGMTAYICGRGIGLRTAGARFLSVAWMLAGYNISWSNWPLPDVSAWLPILFLGLERIVERRYRKGFFIFAFGATLILLAGHPESAFGMCFGLGAYFLARLVWERRQGQPFWKPIGVCVGAWAVAFLAAAIQLAPFFEYLAHRSTFAERFGGHVTAMTPANIIIGFWAPRFFGSSVDFNFWGEVSSLRYTMVYVGMAVWFGIALLAVKGTTDHRSHRVGGLIVACIVSLMLALEVLPESAMQNVPILSAMMPHYHICFVLFALPLLGAIGIDRWFARPRKFRELSWLAPPAIVVAIIVIGFLSFYGGLMNSLHAARFVHVQIATAAAFVLIALLILAGYCLWSKPRLFAGVLTVLLACDLLVAARGLNPTVPRREVFPETALTQFLEGLGKPCRMGVAQAGIISGVLAPYGIEDWLGFDGIYPERMVTFQRELGTAVWDAMEPACAIEYYLNDPRYQPVFPLNEPGRFTQVAELDGIEVFKNNRAFPRAYLAGELKTVADPKEMFAIMRAPTFQPSRTALALAGELRPGPTPHAQSEIPGEARVIEHAATRVKVLADAKEDCVLVLADSFYPGWTAWIDGVRAELFPVYYAFRGLRLPPGEHVVEYRYSPLSLRIGLWTSIGVLVAAIVAVSRVLARCGMRAHRTSPQR